ncbi:DUF4349 domain-containing protein [Bacillus luteolus]|uniref:DUF4349 domain-containing protein n=1 Tax=Litchfieldia luteola TaxID=682179 RepID=A0ABR9QKD4_9BACI|nr:DUF4349 domain-containing protein [Cytobacillus luteolus]MBE4908904.1 DUF4349 domain-containing protein [Cytobacillus luteolus]MBP1941763.1 hypothetical protein [Cytobacillus luteolus]
MNKYKLVITLVILSFGLILAACSGGASESTENSKTSMDMATSEEAPAEAKMEQNRLADGKNKGVTDSNKSNQQSRMVIYHADLQLEVKDYKSVHSKIELLVNEMNGYIVESNVYNHGENQMEGRLTVRVPESLFNSFISQVGEMSEKVNHQNITGQDVTEEYVDLGSRLKSKEVVEERLLQFMRDAKETKDLLQISSDLAVVQEEIEQIKGRMNYLENQANLSTVSMTLYENKVIVPEIDGSGLNTWDKTKKQFMDSINFILGAVSGFFVFLIGNSPILLLLGLLGFVVYLFMRKMARQKIREEQQKSGD